jgi:glutamate-1-semialdehyde 2,1-aminomutase
MLNHEISKKNHKIAQSIFPGGVNSPVRAFGSLGPHPIHFKASKGPFLIDVDDNHYLDFCSSWGPLILGHQDPDVTLKMKEQLDQGLTFGATSWQEIRFGKLLKELMPKLELVRFVNSGTEATMSAVRLARTVTNREMFVKFEGCYHGHYEDFLTKAGSGLLTHNLQQKPINSINRRMQTLPYNNLEALQSLFEEEGNQIAGVIVEPVAANMSLIPAEKIFLQEIRKLCSKFGSVLIFDEVMSGFRVHQEGACHYYNVEPDLWTLGKIIGGGMPAAAYGGKKEIMNFVSPLGSFYQAGTLSGHPLAMTAGYYTLKKMKQQNGWEKLNCLGMELDKLMSEELPNLIYKRVGSFFGIFPGLSKSPRQYSDLNKLDLDLFKKIFWTLISEKIYISPSAYEVNFLNLAQNKEHLVSFIKALKKAVNLS